MRTRASQNLPTPADPALFATLDPDTILPEQFFPAQEPHWTGELALLWTVFTDGIETFQKEVLAGKEESEAFLETLDWIDRDDTDSVFGFDTLCQTFGLKPEWVRVRLHGWHAAHQQRRNAA